MNEEKIDISELFSVYTKYQNVVGDDELSLYKNFLSTIDKDAVHKWINKTFIKETIKDNAVAKEFREAGNKLFLKEYYNEAFEAYSNSIIYAEETSEELSIAFANRSAVHFAQKHYQSCLNDINNCVNVGTYPEKLKNKLDLRKNKCLKLLNMSVKVKESYNRESDLGREYKIPSVIDGPSSKFLFASSSVELVYNNEKGRHVLANKDFQVGDILFVEKPFALVPTFCNDPNVKNRCYFCYKRTNSPIACAKCDTIYCNKSCKESAWLHYHKYECRGSCVNAWQQLGVSYLALRIALLGANYLQNNPTTPNHQVSQFGSEEDNYPYVYSMVTNIKKITNDSKLINLTMALCLCEYLSLKTSFFGDISKRLNVGESEAQIKMGAVILRHLLQVTCNASIVEDFYEHIANVLDDDWIGKETSYVRAAGMYPTHSMLNHSCDSNITLYFCDDVMVVKARRSIKIGEEIYNSYGYSCYKHETHIRLTELMRQYCFVCKCTSCTYPSKPEIFTVSLLCNACKSCSLPVNSDKCNYKCTVCNNIFSVKYSNLIKAKSLLKKDKLIECLELRRQSVPENSELILQTLRQITENGSTDLKNWWKYTQQLIEIEKQIIPYHSITYANNIKFTLDTLIIFLSQSTNFLEVEEISKKVEMLIRQIKELYILFMPPEIIDFKPIDELHQKFINFFVKK